MTGFTGSRVKKITLVVKNHKKWNFFGLFFDYIFVKGKN